MKGGYIPKWYSIMPPLAKEWWEAYLSEIGETTCHTTADTDCPLYNLKHHWQRPASTDASETAEISQQLIHNREKELAPLEEVNTYSHSYLSSI
jgi:hypothetical protein